MESAHAPQPIPGVDKLLAVSSGKGGVGKSTISANLALVLAGKLRVGLLDADIYGPNIPGMLGLEERPEVDADSGHLRPCCAWGLQTLSMGLLIEAGTPVIWRGPMLAKAIQQFLFQVKWDALDLLVIDLPPGTGDVQLTLTQTAPISGALIVSTPSAVALEDVRRGARMFRQTGIPILGLVENMSYFVCSKGHRNALFGAGGGERIARELEIPFLGQIPLDPRLRRSADEGVPAVRAAPSSPGARALEALGAKTAAALKLDLGRP